MPSLRWEGPAGGWGLAGGSLRLRWVLKAFVAKRISCAFPFPFPFERLSCYTKGIKEFRSELTFFIYSTIFIQEPITSWLIWIPHRLFNQQTDQIASEANPRRKGKKEQNLINTRSGNLRYVNIIVFKKIKYSEVRINITTIVTKRWDKRG